MGTSGKPANGEKASPVECLQEVSSRLYTQDPHNPLLYIERAQLHSRLRFPDLAAADAYRSLILLESVVDPEDSDYVARRRSSTHAGQMTAGDDDENGDEVHFVQITREEYDAAIGDAYVLLVTNLARTGCLQDAYDYATRAVAHLQELESQSNRSQADPIARLRSCAEIIEKHYRKTNPDGEFKPGSLSDRGSARRVLYPWNHHEPDRYSAEVIALLNARLQEVAPKLEVRTVELPALHDGDTVKDGKSFQLGVFAKEDLAPGEVILRELSVLTATSLLHDLRCDACSGPLPEPPTTSSSASDDPVVPRSVACDGCEDVIFCSQQCHDIAQEAYHAALCGREELESFGKEVDDSNRVGYLYFLLLARAIAMAATQDIHPLELSEIKYIWGDFHPYIEEEIAEDDIQLGSEKSEPLPFSFQLHIVQPFRLLEAMGLDPFVCLERYDTWVLNTLYAKFRGVASGHLSRWDGRPDLCCVHPLWGLANHSCDPNVRWEVKGDTTFIVRKPEERVTWESKPSEELQRHEGIRKGEEIMSHYCDVDLDLPRRRRWARNILGGDCVCPRCLWEEALESNSA
ncbi:hypothetical protein VTN31DRAFT_1855 [Thermomyces dupontii]|uniref:uncharacterized protein n=1 Tax=Talaromyces thermophilus TaxID=28565 RepID=UPI0037443874